MTITTDPATRLLARPFRPRRPGPDLRMGLSPGLLLTLAMNAAPDAFDPYQGYRPVPGGQIPHPRRPAIMQPRLRSAHRAPTRRRLRLDGVLDFAVTFRYRQHGHAFQPKHRRSTTVVPHLGPFCSCSVTPRIMRPQAHSQVRQTTVSPDNYHASAEDALMACRAHVLNTREHCGICGGIRARQTKKKVSPRTM